MRHFILLLFMAVFTTVIASAQVKVSIVACPQINESFGVRVGSDLDMPINRRWSFVPGIYWSLRNRETNSSSTKNGSTKEVKYSDNAHFVILPLRFGLHIPCKNEDNLALKLLFGTYIAYEVGGNSKSTTNTDGVISHHKTGAFDSDGHYNSRFDYGLNIGLNRALSNNTLMLECSVKQACEKSITLIMLLKPLLVKYS